MKQQITTHIELVRAEMRRIGYRLDVPATPSNSEALYSGRPFEEWLQFEYLAGLEQSLADNKKRPVLDYKIGLAALRQYDYHSIVPEAMGLLALLQTLEKMVADWKNHLKNSDS